MFEEDWAELQPKHCLHRQSGTKHLGQNREIHQDWTGKEKFDIYFCIFFWLLLPKWKFWKRDTRLCLHQNLGFS